MKALLTGHKGFIGANLYKKIISEFESVERIEIDIFNRNSWKELLLDKLNKNKPDVVFHVGAISDTLEKDVQFMMTLNFEFTKILVDWCKEQNVPIIYSSSAANYGNGRNVPENLYAWSKYVAECYVIANNGISLRYFNVYGPGEKHKKKMSSIVWQCMSHKKNKKFKLFPKKPVRDFVYIDDIVEANIYAYKNYDKLIGSYYDVGSGVAEPFERILETLKIKYKYVCETKIPKGYQFYTCSDPNKWMPGWRPKYSLSDGILDYVEKVGWKK